MAFHKRNSLPLGVSVKPWDEGCTSPIGKLLCLWQNQKNMQLMHDNIPFMFDFWAYPLLHLLKLVLLKSSTGKTYVCDVIKQDDVIELDPELGLKWI